MSASAGMCSAPSSVATPVLSVMRRPMNPIARPAARAASATRWMRGIAVAKQETSTRPRARAKMSRNAGMTSSSHPVRPRCSTLVESDSSTSTPRSPHADSVSTSVLSGPVSALILKSPVASTTPAGVSMARARLSSTLCATRIGFTRNGPRVTGSPGESRRKSAVAPRSCIRRRAKPMVSRLPYTGARAASSAKASAPMWSSWPWVSRMPWSVPGRSARYWKSGTMESTPGSSAGGTAPRRRSGGGAPATPGRAR